MGRRLAAEADRGRIEALLPHPILEVRRWPKRRKLASAALVHPLYHGDGCEGLSGLYTVVNAIRLIAAKRRPLSVREGNELLEAGLRFLTLRQDLARSLVYGIRLESWRRLSVALMEYSYRRFGFNVKLDHPLRDVSGVSSDDAFSILRLTIMRRKVPMLLFRGGHYSIISGFTPDSWLLFDSGGRRWIRRRGCGLTGETRHRHQICPWSLASTSA